MTQPEQNGVKPKRMAVARFWYEGNAFTPMPCTLADFQRQEWYAGAEALEQSRDTASELGAVEQFARTRSDWEVVVLRCAAAEPGGPIEDNAYQAIKAEILAGLAAGAEQGWDAVFLSLHGAAITDARQNPDLDLLRAIRQVVPGIPVGASFDLHGNLSPELADLLNVAIAYKTYPHVDQYTAAERALQLLAAQAQGAVPTRVSIHKPGLLLSSFNMRTSAGPMCELQKKALATTQAPLCDISLFGGFPYSDTEDTGASIVITALATHDHDAAVRQAMQVMQAAMHQAAPDFDVSLPTASEGIARALASLQSGPGLVAVTDPGDNPASGGSGDTTALFRELIQTPFQYSCVFASFADSAAVQAAAQAGEGAELTLSLGGRFNPDFGAPVPVRLRVETLTQGEFTNLGPKENGVRMRFGPTALLSLLERPNIRVIVTQFVVPANDPGFFAMHGIDLQDLQLLCVKAKNHFRAAFLPLCKDIIDIDAPGPAALDLSLLPFKNLRLSSRAIS